MGYITISSILQSISLIKPFLAQYYDILAFGDIVKVSHQYRYKQILIRWILTLTYHIFSY